MSDHDAAPDPMDKAYAQAEAVLNDEAARAARRARVLAAVASEAAAATPAQSAPSPRRAAWAPGGWLVAAGVAGLSVLVALQVYQPAPTQPPPAPPPVPAAAASAPPAPPADAANVAPPTAARPAAQVQRPATPPAEATRARAESPEPAPPAPEPAPPVTAAPAPPPPPPSEAPAAVARAAAPARIQDAQKGLAPRPAAAPAGANQVEEVVVVTGQRAARSAASFAGSPAEQAARLRDAAAAGRTSEVKALLARGVPVDAADDGGETALMKAVQADQPAVAALLRRRGASLDLENRAGDSAREMAASSGDAELKKALGLPR